MPPLDADPDSNGKPSDHNIVKAKPISTINNKNTRVTKVIKVQPITDSGIRKMKLWLIEEDWKNVTNAETANKKAEIFQESLFLHYNKCFPIKEIKVASDDQPWVTQKLKKLDRRRKRA